MTFNGSIDMSRICVIVTHIKYNFKNAKIIKTASNGGKTY